MAGNSHSLNDISATALARFEHQNVVAFRVVKHGSELLNARRTRLSKTQKEDGRSLIGNPPFYGELIKMGFAPGSLPDFGQMAAITYVDTVVLHEPFTGRVLFHELVHVLQYEKLGLEQFAAKYVNGFLKGGSYEAIPLEMSAHELDARFAAAPTKPFSVANEIQAWIDCTQVLRRSLPHSETWRFL